MRISGVDISSADKIMFPKKKITKGQMAEYYASVAKKMLPYLKNRPLTLHRFPNGIDEQGFYQKNASEYFPDFIKRIEVETEDGTNTQIICNSEKSLIYLINQGTVTFHIWLSRKDKLHRPDKVVFDLDPPKGDFSKMKKAAFHVRDFLKSKKIDPQIGTTGQNGVHISYKIRRTKDFDKIKEQTRSMAEAMEAEHPQMFTTKIRKDQREGKIFIDYLRNAYAQTIVCPYSLRANEEAGIAMPLEWKEFEKIKSASDFNFNKTRTE